MPADGFQERRRPADKVDLLGAAGEALGAHQFETGVM